MKIKYNALSGMAVLMIVALIAGCTITNSSDDNSELFDDLLDEEAMQEEGLYKAPQLEWGISKEEVKKIKGITEVYSEDDRKIVIEDREMNDSHLNRVTKYHFADNMFVAITYSYITDDLESFKKLKWDLHQYLTRIPSEPSSGNLGMLLNNLDEVMQHILIWTGTERSSIRVTQPDVHGIYALKITVSPHPSQLGFPSLEDFIEEDDV